MSATFSHPPRNRFRAKLGSTILATVLLVLGAAQGMAFGGQPSSSQGARP